MKYNHKKMAVSFGAAILLVTLSLVSAVGIPIKDVNPRITPNRDHILLEGTSYNQIGQRGTTLYVNCGGPGNYSSIQAAIDNATAGDTVYVCSGTYYEHINLKNGVIVQGAGAESTIIDGSNSGRVVTANSVGSNTIFDGFTVTHGWYYAGAGMLNNYSSITVSNCIFKDNSFTTGIGVGAGMYNYFSSINVTNCVFLNNSAANAGGGILNDESSVTVTNCVFANNSALSINGGGIYNYNSSDTIITNSIFIGNSAGFWGGGIYAEGPSCTITNCIFRENTPTQISGSPVVTYCNIEGGYSSEGNIDSDPLFVDSENYDFHLQWGSPCMDAGNNSAPGLPDNDFEGDLRIVDGDWNGIATIDMGIDEWNLLPVHNINKETYYDNIQSAIDDADSGDIIEAVGKTYHENIHMKNGVTLRSTTVKNAVIDGSNSGSVVTAMNIDSSTKLDGFIITNGSNTDGGGIYNQDSSLIITNCIFVNNNADNFGGGMYNNNSSPIATNCVFYNNYAEDGGGIYNLESSPVITNCILWGDTSNEISNAGSSLPVVTYCDIEYGYSGEGNIQSDPRFADPENGDFHLLASPCVDSGTNLALSLPEYDFEGDPRIIDGDRYGSAIVDMGVDEYDLLPVHNVDKDTYYYYISEAIYDAEAGDTIEVSNGTYNDNIDLKNGVTIRGACPEFTVIDGGGNCAVNALLVDSTTILENFTITNGYPGILSVYSSELITNCIIDNNQYNGGMINGYSSPNVTNCVFSNNVAQYGAAMYNDDSAAPNIINCVFSNNYAEHGGGICNDYGSSPIITNCVFYNNSAEHEGGGMCNWGSSPIITNSIFEYNYAGGGGGGISNSDSSILVNNCTFDNNFASWGTGIDNEWSSGAINNCIFKNNIGAGISNSDSSPNITNCIFYNNYDEFFGGGMENSWSSPNVTNCVFYNNSAGFEGGGIYNNVDSSPIVTNCILWGNTPNEIDNDDTSSPVVTYCDIEGGYPGEGNIDVDPLFIDPDNGDFHLKRCSPSIDAGNNSAPALLDFDFEGDPRIFDGDWNDIATVDMGVDEYIGEEPQFIRSDTNNDGNTTMGDIIFILRHLYVPGALTPLCMDAADVNDDGEIEMSDAIYALRAFYVPGSPDPPAPYPGCGVDPTADALGCLCHPCMDTDC